MASHETAGELSTPVRSNIWSIVDACSQQITNQHAGCCVRVR
jgi:hypothetical protein